MSKLRRPFVFTVSAALALPSAASLAACESPATHAAASPPAPSSLASSSLASSEAPASARRTLPARDPVDSPTKPGGGSSPVGAASATGAADKPGSDATPRVSDFPRSRNAIDTKGRTVFRSAGDCWVELPWPEGKPRMPGEALPTEPVTCPEAMKSSAWETCGGGTILGARDGASCICAKAGNPPPPPSRNACPDDPKPPPPSSSAHFKATAAMRMDGSVDGDTLLAETNRLIESLAPCAVLVRGTDPTVGSLNLQVTVSAEGKLNPDLRSPVNPDARRCITSTLRSWTIHGAGTGRAMVLLAVEH